MKILFWGTVEGWISTGSCSLFSDITLWNWKKQDWKTNQVCGTKPIISWFFSTLIWNLKYINAHICICVHTLHWHNEHFNLMRPSSFHYPLHICPNCHSQNRELHLSLFTDRQRRLWADKTLPSNCRDTICSQQKKNSCSWAPFTTSVMFWLSVFWKLVGVLCVSM